MSNQFTEKQYQVKELHSLTLTSGVRWREGMRKDELGEHKRDGQKERETHLRHGAPRVPEVGKNSNDSKKKKPEKPKAKPKTTTTIKPKLLKDKVWLVTQTPAPHTIS